MLTRTCSSCGRKNTTVKVLTPSENHYVNMKCKYHWKVLGSLAAPVETNPFGNRVPGAAIPPYSGMIVADGANHYWKLNESSGTVANDSIGSLPGTISGGVTLGQVGVANDTAMTFNGSTGKIVTASIITTVPITFEAWVKPNSQGGIRVVSSTREGGSNGPFLFGLSNMMPCFYMDNSAPSSVDAGVALAVGVYSHVVGVHTGLAYTFYINGISVKTGSHTYPGATIGGQMAIGSEVSGGSNQFSGSIDELAIYNTVLTPAQILAHYNAGK